MTIPVKNKSHLLQSLWNPFRDWNRFIFNNLGCVADCFKASETLLGIETMLTSWRGDWEESFKASETLLGIETIILY